MKAAQLLGLASRQVGRLCAAYEGHEPSGRYRGSEGKRATGRCRTRSRCPYERSHGNIADVLYNGWLENVSKRFQEKFDEISAHHNFDLGDEFEVSLCDLLVRLLPRRFGVCRGFVVGADGTIAGDDIIIFDAHNFPTLRALATDVARKEDVPAEAVVAYIEAKHTLTLEGDEKGGQSLAKAVFQTELVKNVPRKALTHSEAHGLGPGSDIGVSVPAGRPSISNPYYTAIWARNVRSETASSDVVRAFTDRLGELNQLRNDLPDFIIAGPTVALPFVKTVNGASQIEPFLREMTQLMVLNLPAPWGLALAHLLWAIAWVRPGELPLGEMIVEQVRQAPHRTSGNVPIRGRRWSGP